MSVAPKRVPDAAPLGRPAPVRRVGPGPLRTPGETRPTRHARGTRSPPIRTPRRPWKLTPPCSGKLSERAILTEWRLESVKPAPPNFLAFALFELVPQALGEEPPSDRVRHLATLWNLGGERTPLRSDVA